MSDIAFRVSEISELTRQRAVRCAVFQGLFPKARRIDPDLQTLLDSTYTRWRAFLVRMQKAGWDRVQDRLDMWYIRNCPPCGFSTPFKARTCNTPRLCPWCWGRRFILAPFRQLETVLFGSPDGRNCPHPVKLVECTATYDASHYDEWVDADLDEETVTKQIKWAVKGVHAARRVEINAVTNYGGFVLHRFNLLPGRLLYKRGTILVVPEDAYVAFPRHPEITFREHPPTKQALLSIFGRIARFPAGWWGYPAEFAMIYLAATKRLRLTASHGCCRPNSKPAFDLSETTESEL